MFFQLVLLWIGARQKKTCNEDFIDIDANDNLPELKLLIIVIISGKKYT